APLPDTIFISCNDLIPDPELPVIGDGCFEVRFSETLVEESGCANNIFTLQRNWTTRGFCGDDSLALTQIVKVVDNTPPTLFNIPADVEIQCEDCLSSFQ